MEPNLWYSARAAFIVEVINGRDQFETFLRKENVKELRKAVHSGPYTIYFVVSDDAMKVVEFLKKEGQLYVTPQEGI